MQLNKHRIDISKSLCKTMIDNISRVRSTSLIPLWLVCRYIGGWVDWLKQLSQHKLAKMTNYRNFLVYFSKVSNTIKIPYVCYLPLTFAAVFLFVKNSGEKFLSAPGKWIIRAVVTTKINNKTTKDKFTAKNLVWSIERI